MHPAFSVIFFTVVSGSGYGLIVLLALVRLTGLVPGLEPLDTIIGALIGMILISIGLLSSTFHLANPRNAWRSFTRFKTSWLSREAVFAILFYPVCLLWLMAEWNSYASTAAVVLAALSGLLAFTVLICTSMIYASLKTIRAWHSPLVPISYLLLGLMTGGLVLLARFRFSGLELSGLELVLIVLVLIAAIVKIIYFFWIDQSRGMTLSRATGFTRAKVRLLDVGHTSGTFLTDEFGYKTLPQRVRVMRAIAIVAAFVLPAILLFYGVASGAALWTVLIAIVALIGVLAERWLFFAEAKHVVMLYHGAEQA